MNPYTTRTQARIQPGDIARVTLTDHFTAAAALTALERSRAYQAEAEVERLLKEHGVKSHSTASLVTVLQQAIGASLVRLGVRLSSTSRGPLPGTTSVNGMLRTAD